MSAAALPTSYPVNVLFTSGTSPSASDIYNASQSANKCDDLRIVYNNTTELNRYIKKCGPDGIDIWFRSNDVIASGGTNTSHQLYLGNPSVSNPPADPAQIWYPYKESDTANLYLFQEGSGSTAYDYSGNGRHCTINPSVGWSTAKWGSGLHFGRANNGNTISLSCGSPYPLSALTAEFWLKSDVNNNNIDGRLAGQLGPNGQLSWLLSLESDRLKFERWCNGGSQQARGNVNLRQLPYYGQWNNLAVTFDGGNQVKFYVNGNLDNAVTLDNSCSATYNVPLEIGSVEGSGQGEYTIGAFRLSKSVKTDFYPGTFANIKNEPSFAVGAVIQPPATGSPDLAIISLNAYPDPTGGIQVEAVVQNKGTLSTTNGFFTDLYLDHLPTGAGDYTGSRQFWVNDPIPAGATVTLTTVLDSSLTGLSLQAAAPASEVTGTLYTQVDSVGTTKDLNRSNNVSTGTQVCLANPDAFEGDDTPTGATSLNVTYWQIQHHNMDRLNDQDWVKFAAIAGQAYTFRTLNLSPSADTYLYLYDTDGISLLASNDDDGDSLASHIHWTAPASGTYYLLVRGWNPNVAGCGTGYDLEGRPEITPPTLSTPSNGSVLAATTNITLSWQAKTDQSYTYYAELTGPGSVTNSGWITTTTWNVGVLAPGTYSWRVKTKTIDEFDESNWSAIWTFTVGNAPASFQKSGPANGTSVVSINPTLSWGASLHATSYEYCYYAAGDSGCTSWQPIGTATSTAAGPLNTSTTYFWQVRARNTDGVTEASDGWWSFTTKSCAGCTLANTSWPMFRQNSRHTGQSQANGPASAPVILWIFDADAYEGSAAVLSPDGTVYVGLHYSLFAFAPNGTLKWSYPCGGQVRTPAVTSDGTVYFGSSDGKVYAVRSNGTLKWSYTTGSWIAASPTIAADGTIYIGSADGYFYALNPQGDLKWKYEVGSWINSSAALDGSGNIYFGSTSSWVYSLTQQGVLRWSYQTGTYVDSSPAIANDGTVYIGSIDQKLYALNPNGSLKWSYTTGGAVISSPAIGADGTVYFGSMDNHFYALNPNGTLMWNYPTGDVVNSSAAIGQNGTIYMASQDGSLYSLSPQGNLNWEYYLGGESQGPVLSANGTIYINENGRFYAFLPEQNYHAFLPAVMR